MDYCYHKSTRDFYDGDKIDKEYIHYRCPLVPDIASLIFYFDADNKVVTNYVIIPSKYETIENFNNTNCELTSNDNNQTYGQCYASVKYNFILEHNFLFETPKTVQSAGLFKQSENPIFKPLSKR